MSIAFITGGAGFIGSHIAESLLDYEKILILDNLSSGFERNIPESHNIEFVNGDIRDYALVDQLFDRYSFTDIFHMAAVASVQASVNNPSYTKTVNLDATYYLLEKARALSGLNRFIFPSSAAVYGNTAELPNREDTMVNPITPYALEKFAGERYCLLYASLYNVPAVAFRFFNVYGERQNPKSDYSGVISIFIDKLKNGEQAVIYGDGTQTRDFVYVKDLVNIITNTRPEMVGNVFNIGTGQATTINDLYKYIADSVGSPHTPAYASPRRGDLLHSYASIDKLPTKAACSFTSIINGIRKITQ